MKKFRVWDKFSKRYLDQSEYFIDGNGDLYEYVKHELEDHTYIRKETGDIVITKIEAEYYEIELFTGRQDRDGKDIYQGDIIMLEIPGMTINGYGYIDFLYTYDGGWVIRSEGHYCNLGTRTKQILVVGTKKQNPELLGAGDE